MRCAARRLGRSAQLSPLLCTVTVLSIYGLPSWLALRARLGGGGMLPARPRKRALTRGLAAGVVSAPLRCCTAEAETDHLGALSPSRAQLRHVSARAEWPLRRQRQRRRLGVPELSAAAPSDATVAAIAAIASFASAI